MRRRARSPLQVGWVALGSCRYVARGICPPRLADAVGRMRQRPGTRRSAGGADHLCRHGRSPALGDRGAARGVRTRARGCHAPLHPCRGTGSRLQRHVVHVMPRETGHRRSSGKVPEFPPRARGSQRRLVDQRWRQRSSTPIHPGARGTPADRSRYESGGDPQSHSVLRRGSPRRNPRIRDPEARRRERRGRRRDQRTCQLRPRLRRSFRTQGADGVD